MRADDIDLRNQARYNLGINHIAKVIKLFILHALIPFLFLTILPIIFYPALHPWNLFITLPICIYSYKSAYNKLLEIEINSLRNKKIIN